MTAMPARTWECSECGHVGPWADGWRWFGSYTLTGRGAHAAEEPNVERVLCPAHEPDELEGKS